MPNEYNSSGLSSAPQNAQPGTIKAGTSTDSAGRERGRTETPSTLSPDPNLTPVTATLVRGRKVWLWLVMDCPHCGRLHQHGGGYLAENPYTNGSLGHRHSHCADETNPGYVLVADSANQLVQMLRGVSNGR